MRFLFIPLLLLAASCAPARFVEPVPEGHWNATASLGGPLFDFAGTTIPMPLTSLAAGYGIAEKTTAFAGLHTTALLFDDIQLDLGALQEIVPQTHFVPAISVSPMLNLLLAMRAGSYHAWPEADVNFYWHYGSAGNLIYINSSNWFELSSTRADNEPQTTHWIANFGLGHRIEGEHWEYVTELKYLAAGMPNLPNAVGYHGIGGNGAFGVYLGLTRKF